MSNPNDFVIENGVLKKYVGPGGDVVVPDGVTEIGDRAFKDCRDLTCVTIPETVTSIVKEAFSGCYRLKSVSVPQSLISIGERAFSSCGLPKITIPKSVKELGRQAFSGCPDITVFDSIDPNASDCYAKIDMTNGNPNSEVGFVGVDTTWVKWVSVYDHKWRNHTITVRSAETNEIKCVVYMEANPSQREYQCLLTSAWGHNATFAFRALDEFFPNIKDMKLPVALSRLKYRVDLSEEAEAQYLKYLSRNARKAVCYCVDTKDTAALAYCAKAKAITSKNVEELLEYATDKNNREAVAFILDYKNKCLVSCSDEKLPAMKKSTEKPKKEAKPKNEWTIKKESDGSGIIIGYLGEESEIKFPIAVDGIKIRGIANRRSETPENYKRLVSVVIPEGYIVIGSNAFRGCTALKTISFPPTIEKIGNEAFAECASLETVVFPPLLPGLFAEGKDGGKEAFRDCPSLRDIYVTNPKMYITDRNVFKGTSNLTIHAQEASELFRSPVCKNRAVMTGEEIQMAAAALYGVPRIRTVFLKEGIKTLPVVGDSIHFVIRTVETEQYGIRIKEEMLLAVSENGTEYGSPMIKKFYLAGGEGFSEDKAVYLFADLISAKVTSKPRKIKKTQCFDIELQVAE